MRKIEPQMNTDERGCRNLICVHLRLSAVLFFLFASWPVIAEACPLCRDSVDQTQAAGFNGSVEWMLGGLVFVVGTLVIRVWRGGLASLRDSR